MIAPRELMRDEPQRLFTRVEYDRLVLDGFFDEAERVELLFGMVVEMAPIDPAHNEAVTRVHRILDRQIGDRANVRSQTSFAASDISEPEPDTFVTPNGDYWRTHPTRAFLIVEIANSSLRRDRGPKALLYGLAAVDEYWIVDIVNGAVEVYRDRQPDGSWERCVVVPRGDTVAMLAFPDVTVDVATIVPPI